MPQHTMTVTGVLTNDPKYKRVTSETGVSKLRIAASRGEFVNETWVNHDQLYLNVECWGALAENAKRSLQKGSVVIIVGTLVTQEWKVDGENRSRTFLKATHIGPDLRTYVTSQVPWPNKAQGAFESEYASIEAKGTSWIDETAVALDQLAQQDLIEEPSFDEGDSHDGDSNGDEDRELVSVGASDNGEEENPEHNPPF